jgi:hypothetical protein
MALKSKYSSIDALAADLKRAINELRQPKYMKQIGELSAELIRVRTRLGYGVEKNDGPRQRLKPLAQSTIDQRAGKLAFFTTPDGVVIPYKPDTKPTLSGFTTPKKSNLTRTGQMLASIKPFDAKLGEVKVGPKGSRGGESLTNEKLMEYVTDAGRPFNYHTKTEIKQLQQLVEEIITKLLK